MAEHKCANCSRRKHYDENPNSIGGKLWRWHINWCPGWKSYMKSLGPDEYKKVQQEYKWKIK